jgi:hypothetical protein
MYGKKSEKPQTKAHGENINCGVQGKSSSIQQQRQKHRSHIQRRLKSSLWLMHSILIHILVKTSNQPLNENLLSRTSCVVGILAFILYQCEIAE